MILTGVVRLGRDVELRDHNGQKVCNLAGAYNHGRAAEQGGQRPTQWIDVSLWGRLAESLAPYLKKGKEVWVCCSDVHVEMGVRQQDGSPWNKLVGRIDQIQLIGPRDQSAAPAAAAPRPAPAPAPRPAPAPAAGGDDSVPF